MSAGGYRNALLSALRTISEAGCELDRALGYTSTDEQAQTIDQARQCLLGAADTLREILGPTREPQHAIRARPPLIEVKS